MFNAFLLDIIYRTAPVMKVLVFVALFFDIWNAK